MGTESTYPIGTILRRKEKQDDAKDELRVVGGGKDVIVMSNVEFGQSFAISGNAIRADYEVEVPDAVYLEQPGFVQPGPSPEQIFAEKFSKKDEEATPAAPAEPETPRSTAAGTEPNAAPVEPQPEGEAVEPPPEEQVQQEVAEDEQPKARRGRPRGGDKS